MKYLCIANKGKIEVEALTLVGASTKRGSQQIGMFGSGNKYALAFLLRNNYDVKLYRGTEQVDVSVKKHTLRGQEFDVIYIDGQQTSITTEMGHKWELWQALRELYANAIDEGLLYFDLVDSINPSEENDSYFYIKVTPEIKDFMFNIQDYFAINKQVVFENETGKIYKKHGNKTCVYRKGIRCFETERASLFDYDLNNVDINEDRIATRWWEVIEDVWKLLSSCDDPVVSYEILNNINKDHYIENDIDHNMVDIFNNFNEAWTEPLENKNVCPSNMSGWLGNDDKLKTYFVPNVLYNKLSSLTKNKAQPDKFKMAGTVAYREVDELSDHKAKILEKVYDFFTDTDFDIMYKWKVVSFADKKTLGTIDTENETILVSDTIFEQGIHKIINTIIEEYIHLKYNVYDETRGFQESIIDEFVGYMKKKNNINY
jgi:hypothetical protein